MATFKAVNSKRQSKSGMIATLLYITDPQKTRLDDRWLASGFNCTAATSFLEMQTTKQQFRKTGGKQYYHFVQSFHPNEQVSPEQVHRIGLEFAAKRFPQFDVVVATHTDTEHLHNHFLVNSVSFQTGKKLHQSGEDLRQHRQVNDEICLAHGLTVLEPYDPKQQKKGIQRGEYEAARQGRSWKFELIRAIEDALLYSSTKEQFIENMEYEGFSVSWRDDRKYITFTHPNGMKCRDRSLHDETYRKDNLEALLKFRQEHGFQPLTPEPESGWLSQIHPTEQVVESILRIGKNLEDLQGQQAAAQSYIHTDSKQRQREALKKLAQGHQLQSEQDQSYNLSY